MRNQRFNKTYNRTALKRLADGILPDFHAYEETNIMPKTILVTGATDGIGLETARLLASLGHNLLLHGRNPEKLEAAAKELARSDGESAETYVADLSRLSEVGLLAKAVADRHTKLDVLINNAGVYKTPDPITENGIDLRFAVNTLAPYLLTKKLLPLMDATGRVINVSSAAQAPVNLDALVGRRRLDDMEAYAQSKLAIAIWSREMADSQRDGPVMIAVNPGSLLASKMVKEGFGVAGKDLSIGADILARAAISAEFANANGRYFDNDKGQFASLHGDAANARKREQLIEVIERLTS